MAGGYYVALSGMRARMDALDRVASDIANASTTGYKGQRSGTNSAERPSFNDALQSAVDVTNGAAKLDLRSGAVAPTGRSLDLAVQGNGFFALDTPAGPRYTRNGHINRRDDGVLVSDEGYPVLGASGSITIGTGAIDVDADGTVRVDGAAAGKLKVVEFDAGASLVPESGSRFRTDAQPRDVARPSIQAGALEQSNVSIVDRVAELTSLSRSYATLLRGVSVLMNDVDSRAISELGRR